MRFQERLEKIFRFQDYFMVSKTFQGVLGAYPLILKVFRGSQGNFRTFKEASGGFRSVS